MQGWSTGARRSCRPLPAQRSLARADAGRAGDDRADSPFYVEGAEPGDTLVVKVLDVQLDATRGVGVLGPGFGALTGTAYMPMLRAPLSKRIWFYPVDKSTALEQLQPLSVLVSVTSFRAARVDSLMV
jgi:hypothetical protein